MGMDRPIEFLKMEKIEEKEEGKKKKKRIQDILLFKQPVGYIYFPLVLITHTHTHSNYFEIIGRLGSLCRSCDGDLKAHQLSINNINKMSFKLQQIH